MLEILESLEAWHWMLLAIVLLGLEALGAGGILMGAGVAAFFTCFVAFSDAEWQVQVSVFVFLSGFLSLIYYKKFLPHINKADSLQSQKSNKSENSPFADMVGLCGVVIVSNDGQFGEALIKGKPWKITCKQNLKVDDEVSVKRCNGKTLAVYKLI